MQLIYSHIKFRKADWPGKTYHAKVGDWKFTVDNDGRRWTLRSWKNNDFKAFPGKPPYGDAGYSAKALMEIVNDFAKGL